VLLVLGDGVSRAQLEALQPDTATMHAAASAELVHGVIVSISDAAAAAAGAAPCRPAARSPYQLLAAHLLAGPAQ
jgi:hypothetical protein